MKKIAIFLMLTIALASLVTFADASTTEPLIIEEWIDFGCPFSARVQDALVGIQNEFGDRVQIELKHHPWEIHEGAYEAALAYECAKDQGKATEYAAKLFSYYPESLNEFAEGEFIRYANELNLDETRFETCLSSREFERVIESDMQEARSKGVTGTPTLLIGSQTITGAHPYEKIRDAVLSELGDTCIDYICENGETAECHFEGDTCVCEACADEDVLEWDEPIITFDDGQAPQIGSCWVRMDNEWVQFKFDNIDKTKIDSYVLVELNLGVTNRMSGSGGLDGLLDVVINPDSSDSKTYREVLFNNVDTNNIVKEFYTSGSYDTKAYVAIPKEYISDDGELIIKVIRHRDNSRAPQAPTGHRVPIRAYGGERYLANVYENSDPHTVHLGVSSPSCEDGARITAGEVVVKSDRIVEFTCTDSDGGENYYLPGAALRIEQGEYYSYTDRCIMPNGQSNGGYVTDGTIWYDDIYSCDGDACRLAEAFCTDASDPFIVYDCQYGCSNGACIEESNQGIIVDGSPSDWDESDVVYTYLGDDKNEVSHTIRKDGTPNWVKRLSITDDGEKIYFLMEMRNPILFNYNEQEYIKLDLDANENTGCAGSEISFTITDQYKYLGDVRDCSAGPNSDFNTEEIAVYGQYIEVSAPLSTLARIYGHVSKIGISTQPGVSQPLFYYVGDEVAEEVTEEVIGDSCPIGCICTEDSITCEGSSSSGGGAGQLACISGCKLNDKCLAHGIRIMLDGKNSFCDLNSEWELQKDTGKNCQNSYECETNFCSKGACVDIAGQMEENRSLMEKILAFFRGLFG